MKLVTEIEKADLVSALAWGDFFHDIARRLCAEHDAFKVFVERAAEARCTIYYGDDGCFGPSVLGMLTMPGRPCHGCAARKALGLEALAARKRQGT